jgi:hypothetical protein
MVALIAALAVPMSAAAAEIKAPTTPMTVDSSIVKAGVHAAANTSCLYLGANLVTERMSDYGTMVPSSTASAVSKLGTAETMTRLGVFGTSVNKSPDPYLWNFFYNLYADTSGGAKAKTEDTVLMIPAGSPAMADTTIISELGTSYTLSRRPDILVGASPATNAGNDQSGNAYATLIADLPENKDGNAANDYSPQVVPYSMNTIYDLGGTMYSIADAMKKSGKSGRYGDPVTIAQTYERYLKGVQLYVLSKIADGTVKEKTVAVVNPAPAQDGRYQIFNSENRDGAGSDIRYLEYVEQTTKNLIDVLGIKNEGSAGAGATYYATAAQLAGADVIILNNASSTANPKEAFIADLQKKGVGEASIAGVEIFGTPPDTAFGIAMRSVENIYGIPVMQGFVYPEIVNPINYGMYLYENFYHIRDLPTIRTLIQENFKNASLAKGATINPNAYSAKAIEANLAAGFQYYAQNASKFAASPLKPSSRLTGIAKIATPKKVSISALTAAKKAFTVKFKKVGTATGYEIRYVVSGKSKWTVKTTGKLTLKVAKLKSGTKYKVQVRAVTTKNGFTAKGAWSTAKTVRVK